jgi:hypothetical protein
LGHVLTGLEGGLECSVLNSQYMARMGVLNDYLAHLPTVFNSSMAVKGTKKGNVPLDEADLARIILNSAPV